MAKCYAITDKEKRHIKIDYENGRLYIFEQKEQAYDMKDILGFHGEHDLYVVPVPVIVKQFKETEYD